MHACRLQHSVHADPSQAPTFTSSEQSNARNVDAPSTLAIYSCQAAAGAAVFANVARLCDALRALPCATGAVWAAGRWASPPHATVLRAAARLPVARLAWRCGARRAEQGFFWENGCDARSRTCRYILSYRICRVSYTVRGSVYPETPCTTTVHGTMLGRSMATATPFPNQLACRPRASGAIDQFYNFASAPTPQFACARPDGCCDIKRSQRCDQQRQVAEADPSTHR